MTTSALLREAAAAIRAKAEGPAPGPWLVIDENEGMWPPRPGWAVVNDAYLNPPADDDEPWLAIELHTGVEADAHHIASWPPETALAVADLLEHEADRADHQPYSDSAIDAAEVLAGRVLGVEVDLEEGVL